MPGKVIGTTIPRGFAGNVSRMSDNVIEPFNYAASNSGNIAFGEVVAFDATNNGVRKVASTDLAANIVGIAVRNVAQPKTDSNDGFYYAPGETVDVLVRGSIMVELESVTGLAPMGPVYLNPTTGKLTSVSTSNVQLTNMKFGNGYADTDKVTEVIILTRAL